MSDQQPEPESPGEDRITGWGVFAGVMTVLVMSPFVFFASLQGGWVGPVAVLAGFIAFVAFLVRSDQKSLGFGLALGYVLITVFTAGLCTGWAELVL